MINGHDIPPNGALDPDGVAFSFMQHTCRYPTRSRLKFDHYTVVFVLEGTQVESFKVLYRVDKRGGWPAWLFAALIGYATFLFMPQVLNDGDTYLHIGIGEWILRHGSVPDTDPFSYTFAGKPWVAHEWLSQLVMAFVFRLGGWNGLVILFGGALALTLGMLARHLARWLDPLSAAVTLILIVGCMSPTLLARPHILALPVLEMWVAGLLIARDRKQAPSPFLLLLMLAWVNLHGSFIFGLLLIGPFALEATLAADARWQNAAYSWGIFSVGAVASTLITPYGWHSLTFPFHLMNQELLSSIDEWHSTDFHTLQPIELALMAVLYVGLSRGVRVPKLRLLILIGVLHFALEHRRHQLLAGLVGGLVLAEPLGHALGAMPAVVQARKMAWKCLEWRALIVLIALLTVIRIAQPVKNSVVPPSPAAALDHVPVDLAAMPVLNDVRFGGYLIYRGIRPFVDGRIELYEDKFMTEYLEMMLPDRMRLERTIKNRDIRWTVMPATSPAIAAMDTLPGWRRLYADQVAIVHVRTTTP